MIKLLQIIESCSNPLFYEIDSGKLFLFQEFVVKVFYLLL